MAGKRPPLKDTNNNTGLIGLSAIPSQAPVASFNFDQIENLIRTKGFLCFHYRNAFNPLKEKQQGPSDPNRQISIRGLRYYNPRPLYHIPRNYTNEDLLTAQAVFEKGSVLVNISGRYADEKVDETNIVHIRHRDLIIFPSITDMTAQLFEYNPTGPQKLQYKVKGVDLLFDDKHDYVCDQDYKITEDGLITWIKGGRKPDFSNGKGSVLSIVYYYTPIYIVSSMLHALRVIPSNPQGSGALPREATYAPQQVVCVPSSIIEENNLLDWTTLPQLPDWPASKNTTGGSV